MLDVKYPPSVFFILGVIVIATIAVLGIHYYCEYGDNKISNMNSPCFDPYARCEWECESYNSNFTGEIDGCMCDCGDFVVSACSGFGTSKMEYCKMDPHSFLCDGLVVCEVKNE